jgi:hypothetical protein
MMRIAAAICIDDAEPTKLRTRTDTIGPAISSSRGLQRSARCPNPICETEADSWKSIVRVPAAASDNPSRGISSGNSGAKMLPYPSTTKCTDATKSTVG